MRIWLSVFVVCALSSTPGCDRRRAARERVSAERPRGPCDLALTPHPSGDRFDAAIAAAQAQVRTAASQDTGALERLGWRFVAKARANHHAGFYQLAAETARCMEAQRPVAPEALLLRGHALHSQHRFAEAELLARELVARRGEPADFGLLGDALLDQGQVAAAAGAYQRMMDLKPTLESYARAAHIRWLRGDVEGARAALDLAVRAAGRGAPEPTAWALTRLALVELERRAFADALAKSRAALELMPDYAPALFAQGRILLASQSARAAVPALERAAALDPATDYEWTLAEALQAAGEIERAEGMEKRLIEHGERSDPRTLALFLATRRREIGRAVELARRELDSRRDVFTHDACAWALVQAGDLNAAHTEMTLALAEGTRDARLFYHAGAIALARGERRAARKRLLQARALDQMLLPSEKKAVRVHLESLTNTKGDQG